MKKIRTLFCLVCAVLVLSSLMYLNHVYAQNVVPVKLFGHRGYSSIYPENTIRAFNGACKNGFDGLEIDIWESYNGDLMIFHDRNTKRLCGKSEAIWKISTENRDQYLVKQNGMKELIPTFPEVLELVRKTKMPLLLHVKAAPGYQLSNEGVNRIISLIKQYEVTDQVYVFANNEKVIQPFCNKGVRIGRVTVSSDKNEVRSLVDWLAENNGELLIINRVRDIKMMDPGFVEYCHTKNVKVGSYFTETLEEFEYMISIKADFAMADSNLLSLYQDKYIRYRDSGSSSTYNYATIVSMKNRTGLKCTVEVKTDKVRKYYIYKQTGQPEDSKFLESHGCSTCALATVLNSAGGYNYTPAYIHKKLIPKKLGRRYTMPIKLYGIHKILKKYKIYSKFVPRFTKAKAKKDITKWLKRGGMVIVTVNSGPDKRWTSKHHSFVLLGLQENGVVIVGDSAQTNFQGNRRIKKARLENIVRYMIPCTSSRYTYCWPGTSTAGGYILTGRVKK